MSFLTRPLQAQVNTARRNARAAALEALVRRLEREDAERFIQEHQELGAERATRRAAVTR